MTKSITITITPDDADNSVLSCEREGVSALEAVMILADAQKAFVTQFVEARAQQDAFQQAKRIQIARQ